MTDTKQLYEAQNEILDRVMNVCEGIALLGGTALSRCYLEHRISYDLDFFLDHRFDPASLLVRLTRGGIAVTAPEVDDRDNIAMQIHGCVDVQDVTVKVSFIEDTFCGMFDTVQVQMHDGSTVVTETLDGLMHRKLRTVSGCGVGTASTVVGGRQTARDLFDLYVLNEKHARIPDFIKRVNEHGANFPVSAYMVGLRAMPWTDMLDEFDEIEPTHPYSVDIRQIRASLEDYDGLQSSLDA